MNKTEYCRYLESGFAAMQASGSQYSTDSAISKIAIAAAGRAAEIRYATHEKMSVGGRFIEASMACSASVVERTGKPVLTLLDCIQQSQP